MNDEPSQAAIARALGLAKSRITALKKQGMPTDSVQAAQAWREARQSIARRKSEPQDGGSSTALQRPPTGDAEATGERFDDARTRRERAEANLAEARDAEQRGELIRVEAVKTALASVFSSTRDAILQIPARLSPLLAAESDPARVQTMLYAELHAALRELAGAPTRLGQTTGTIP